MPGAVLVALPGTRPAGAEAWWQVSQAVPEGMCAPAPIGAVAGMTTMLVMPVNEAPLTVGPWQPTQVVRPAWLIAELVNFAPSTTGVAATLEPAPTWQLSQAALAATGTCPAGMPTTEKPIFGIAKLGAALPWHCAQLPLVLGAYRWMLVSDGTIAKSVPVWQFVHCDVGAVGMWFDG